jgi:hypothetical protein
LVQIVSSDAMTSARFIFCFDEKIRCRARISRSARRNRLAQELAGLLG